nr:hypothetical protein GCM10020093_030150 [Planobispora longispora]
MPGPVADRLALMRTTEANLEPIFLLYEGRGGAATRLVDEVADSRPPLAEARTHDGIRHRLWAVTDPAELAALNADLRPRQALIADGHHRYATYLALQAEHHATARHAGTPGTTGGDSDRTRPGSGPVGGNSAAASAPGTGPWDFGLALLVDSDSYPPDLKAIHRVIPNLPLHEAVGRAKHSWQIHEHAGLTEGLTALREAPSRISAHGRRHRISDHRSCPGSGGAGDAHRPIGPVVRVEHLRSRGVPAARGVGYA